MDLLKEGGSVVCPPLFSGTNYGYWKSLMRAFIKSFDELTWKVVLTGWTPPTKKDELGNEFPKRKLDWTAKENKQSSNN